MISIIHEIHNKDLMQDELDSLKFQRIENIKLIDSRESVENYKLLITDNSFFSYSYPDISFVLIVKKIDQLIKITHNVILIQYESEMIKWYIENEYPILKKWDSIVINRIPRQKLEIEPLETQDATIFFHGKDTVDNMVDELFSLDRRTYYEIQFYNEDTEEIPSKKHRLSWNVTTNINDSGIISNKILKEIENGCLPILLKENAPDYFKSYPFFVTVDDINDQELLVNRVKEISHFISKMTREEFSSLCNSIYNSIYVSSKWNYNFYLLSVEINRHL